MNNYQPPFTLTMEMMNLVGSIMEQVGEIKNYTDLNRLPRLRKQNRIKSIYSSCAIEANSLSLSQVTDVINGKKVLGPEKEILEVKNAIEAYSQIETINPYSMNDLKKAHRIFTKNLVTISGEFRNNEEGVFNGDKCLFIAPPPTLVPNLMEQLYTWLNENKDKLSPFILSSIFHYEFVFIHPFQDGNGRLARYIQTAILGSYNSLFYWIPLENTIHDYQEAYYNAIAESNTKGESTPFILFMLQVINDTLTETRKEIKLHANHLNIYTEKLLQVMELNIPYTSLEIMNKLNLKSKETFRKNYLNPAIESGLVVYEYPDKPTTKLQRYIKIK